MNRIYVDNCKTSKPAPEAIDAMMIYLKEKYQYPGDFVSTKTEIADDISSFKKIISKSINAKENEFFFTTGGTSANNLAIKGILEENSDTRKHIICSVIDYPDLLTNAAYFDNKGYDVTYLSVDWDGFIDLDELQEAIQPNTVLFMTTMVNHTIGTIQKMDKIKEILELADHKILYHVDACQAYGRIPVDVEELGVDTLSISAHKIHGVQGVGGLFIRKGTKMGLVKHGIARFNQFETGNISIPAMAAFAKATELAFTDFDKKTEYIRGLGNYLLEKIEATIPDTMLNGPKGNMRAPHNMNVSFDYIEGEAIMMMLDMYGIEVDTGSACASKGLSANYVLMGTGRNHVQSHSSMKFTFSRYNTKEEIDFIVEKLAEIVQELRNRSPLYNKEN